MSVLVIYNNDTGFSCMFIIVVLVVKIVDCSMEWERLYESS